MGGREKPRLRQAFDAVERPAARTLEAAVQSDKFAAGLSVFVALRHQVAAGLESLSRTALHAVNLPAASDIKRVLTEVHNVDRSLAHDVDLILKRVEALERNPTAAQPRARTEKAPARSRATKSDDPR